MTFVEHALFWKNSRVVQLATAVRGASLHAYSNGQSKAITMELVSLVRQHGVCRFHTSRLNVYVSTQYRISSRNEISMPK